MTRSTRRGPWLPEEDQTLLQLVRSQGPNNWVRISQHMQHRSPKQCRERYHQNLKPSLNHDPISAQEGEMIEQLVREMGRHWAEIARRLGNRSDNAVKNWWNGSMNRRKRHGPQSGGLKTQVGPRTQPIPATRTPRPAFHEDSRRVSDHQPTQQMSQGWTQQSPQPRTLGPPMVSHEPSKGKICAKLISKQTQYSAYHHSASQYAVYDPRILRTEGNGQVVTPTGFIHTSEPLHHSHSYQRAQILHSAATTPPPVMQHLPPLSWHGSRAGHEQALASPGASETSQAPSIQQAPSLVSDNQSTYSVSPKTVPSPRPNVLAPIDTTATQGWHHEQPAIRRSSVPNLTPRAPHADDGYLSAVHPLSGVSEPKSTCYPPILDRESLRQPSSQKRYTLPPPHQLSIPLPNLQQMGLPSPSDLSPNSARDARMHVANILG